MVALLHGRPDCDFEKCSRRNSSFPFTCTTSRIWTSRRGGKCHRTEGARWHRYCWVGMASRTLNRAGAISASTRLAGGTPTTCVKHGPRLRLRRSDTAKFVLRCSARMIASACGLVRLAKRFQRKSLAAVEGAQGGPQGPGSTEGDCLGRRAYHHRDINFAENVSRRDIAV